MKSLEGRTAVVTGAASGIGLAMAESFLTEGMNVVMSDVEADALQREVKRLSERYPAIGCSVNVQDIEEVRALLQAAQSQFGNVHILCNNAGVSGTIGLGKAAWEIESTEWDWVLGVNLKGVINGLQVFVPHMLAHQEESHIVNTSSGHGMTSGLTSAYAVSKHALTRLTEGLYYDLQARNASIGTTLLIPGAVATSIMTSARNQPHTQPVVSENEIEKLNRLDAGLKSRGMPPSRVGDMVIDAVLENRFYLFTHPENMPEVSKRFDAVTRMENPS